MLGFACFLSCFALGIVGGAVLHPDWGIANKNKTIRYAHKVSSRVTLVVTWYAAFMGLQEMTQDTNTLALFGVPLIILVPVTFL